jgi:hypothetical protein
MTKQYKVNFVLAEVAPFCRIPHITMGAELDEVVTASSKSDAVMKVVATYNVFQILSVKRIK